MNIVAEKKNDHWIKSRWRPAMAWQYFSVCLFDFILAPIMYTIYSSLMSTELQVWEPLTLKAGGLYHVAMAAVLGIAAWSRGQEKLKGMD